MNNPNFDLTGRTGIVTGGAGGMGLSAARALMELGAEIVLLDLNPNTIAIAADEVKRGNKCHGVVADLSTQEGREKAFEKAMLFLSDRLDILINYAGIQRRNEALYYSMDDWNLVMNIDLTASFSMCQLAARVMKENGKGKIINIGSMSSFVGNVNICAYTAAKGGTLTLTKALANEWAKYGINVNGIAPGHILTEFTRSVWEDKEKRAAILSRTPMGRWGTVEDIRGPIQFLSSDASEYITGVMLPVDGGYLSM